MRLSKLKLTLMILVSVLIGIVLYYTYTETSVLSFSSKEESVSLELMEVNNSIDLEALAVLEDVKKATATLEKAAEVKNIEVPSYKKYLGLIDTVTLIEEFRALLDPENFKCGFNKKLSSKIKGKEGWIPSEIRLSTKDSVQMNKKVLKFKESSSAYVFNLYDIICKVHNSSGTLIDTIIQAVPEGSLLFKNNQAFNFLNIEKSSFVVNFDCDGYYKAAISAGLGGGKGDVETNAKASQGKTVSAFVGMAYIYSPLQYIMEPASTPINGVISNYEKFSHLASVLSISRIIGVSNYSVKPTEQIKMVWASNSGSTSLNNKVDISASGSLGFFTASADGSVTVNRGASYSNFNSYLIGRVNSPVGIYSKADIAKRMAQIFTSIELNESPKWVNNDLVFSIKINEGYCNQVENEWRIEEAGFKLDNMYVDSSNKNLCRFIIDGDINSTLKRITLKGKIEGQDVYRIIDLPILD